MTDELILDTLFDFELDLPDDSDLWPEKYPIVQWNNNERAWEFPLKYWAGSEIENNYDLVNVDHGADSEAGFLLDTIQVAVLAWRYTWETPGPDGRLVYSLTPDFENGNGWRKRYNFLTLIQETASDEPALITAKGYTGEFLYNALAQGRKRTLRMIQQWTGKKMPGYLFWIPLTAGAKRMVGKKEKSAIYPPAPLAYELPETKEGRLDLLRTLYVGDAYRDLIAASLHGEAQTWRLEHVAVPALPASLAEPAKVELLPDGTLYFPDLSAHAPPEWLDLAMTVPGLFEHRSHASNAFAKVLREKRLAGGEPAQQWEAWRAELEKRWADTNEALRQKQLMT